MNILFINPRPNNPNNVSDFQADMILDGFRSTNHFIYDYPKCHHMYKEYKDLDKIWGKGFNFYAHLEDRKDIDIETYNWDLCIINLHWTIIKETEIIANILDSVLYKFKTNQICIIDGWDLPNIHPMYKFCIDKGIHYFKRELYGEEEKYLHPITFGIPENKICNIQEEKIYDIAPLIPVNQNIDPSYMQTYIYKTEESYNKMYNQSKYGLTSKKGGWDCFRHYEMIANRCIPYFIDIESCPKNCMFSWPKKLLKEIKEKTNFQWNWKDKDYGITWPNCSVIKMDNPGYLLDYDESYYNNTINELQEWLQKFGTTKAIAEYMLSKL